LAARRTKRSGDSDKARGSSNGVPLGFEAQLWAADALRNNMDAATVRTNVTIDWTVRDNVRAHLRVLVKRILRKYGYPPDKQEKATQTVLEQAEVLSEQWAVA
jgi:hypothetical protein